MPSLVIIFTHLYTRLLSALFKDKIDLSMAGNGYSNSGFSLDLRYEGLLNCVLKRPRGDLNP